MTFVAATFSMDASAAAEQLTSTAFVNNLGRAKAFVNMPGTAAVAMPLPSDVKVLAPGLHSNAASSTQNEHEADTQKDENTIKIMIVMGVFFVALLWFLGLAVHTTNQPS